MFKADLSMSGIGSTNIDVGRFEADAGELHLGHSLTRLFVRFALILFGGLISVSAHANIACEVANIDLAIAAGNIALPVSTVPGTTLGTISSSTFQMKCHFTNRVNNVTAATNYANLSTKASLATGYNDLYKTNIAGIGVRYTFNSSDCNVKDVVMQDGKVKIGCFFEGPIGGPVQTANITVTPTLVVTGAIGFGTSTLSTSPLISIVYTSSDQDTSWSKGDLFSGSATGTFVHPACSVSRPAVPVTLPSIGISRLSSGVGSTAGAEQFSLSFSCSSGAKVLITLTDSVDTANRSNTLQLKAGSTAKGVGVQILNGNSPVSFGPDSDTVGNTNQWTIGSSPDGALDVPLTARYIRTGALLPGTVNALATFTMSYQ
ncbi:fimbrial protein [Paraburkholderia madseniana]|jgi:type 1 fimbria pilin|uniref:Fimbrial protein n=1 Tax=Paraburkholderia madseniana TaxID=2599607 RepID=A0A6N6WMW8_9BURK|nr:fimbrial protein [Paraburkholderia madseniana]KAE8762032.1 fimbrial protein [Paraburkholderia madseniana]